MIFFMIQKWSLAGIRIMESCRWVSNAWWNWLLTGTFMQIFKKCHLTKDQSLFSLKRLEKSESRNVSNYCSLIYYLDFQCLKSVKFFMSVLPLKIVCWFFHFVFLLHNFHRYDLITICCFLCRKVIFSQTHLLFWI